MIYFVDIEANGLLDEPDLRLHCLSVLPEIGEPVTYIEGNWEDGWGELNNWFNMLTEEDTLVYHNHSGYDSPALIKMGIIKDYSVQPDSITLMDGTVKNVQLIDTLALSRSWYPDLPGGHGLEAYAKRLGTFKPEIPDWKNLPIEDYVDRCENDVITTEQVFEYLNDKLGIDLENLSFNLKLALATYNLMCVQERTGVHFDITAAEELVLRIDKQMEAIRLEIEPQLPTRPLKKGELNRFTPPKLQFKKDGTPSSLCLKWFDEIRTVRNEVEEWYQGKKGDSMWYALPHHEPIIDALPMELKDQAQIKDWLLSLGWKPTLWNFSKNRDERGRKVKTSPKFHEKGDICPNLERLGDKVDLVRPLITWLSYKHRRSMLKSTDPKKTTGLLNHPRLKIDGRLPAAAGGLTNTKRQKHRTVANIPKVGTLLGAEMRSLFIPAQGKVFVGYDASGLEARVEAERSFRFDNGLYAAELLEGDIHAKNALVFGTDRDGAKSPKYAITYGCYAPKLAGLLGCSDKQAQVYIDGYWDSNYSVAQHRQSVIDEWKTNHKKYITGVLGDKIVTRAEHALLNADFQNYGAVIMDIAGAFMDRWVKNRDLQGAVRVVYYHDEYIWECFEKDSELISELGVKSIIKAGEYLKMNVALDAEAKTGKSWKEVH